MIKFDSKHYCINDFREWNERKELILTPKFQRREVWSPKARSYLIDTVIRGFPISKIFMRHSIEPKTKKSTREIIDGQQRMSTILNFLNDGFAVSPVFNKQYGGYYFNDLPDVVQKEFLEYQISVDVLVGAEDKDVLDIFARLNTYTVKLNKQELRNAKFLGLFKQLAYSLGHDYMSYWINAGVLANREVARMGEAEFASELLIICIDGLQDRKKIDDYYKKYDDKFPGQNEYSSRFKKTIDAIAEIIGDKLINSNITTKPLFYSLFGVLHDANIHKSNYPKVLSALQTVDNILETEPDEISPKDFKFYDASTKHVTDLDRRKIRHEYLKNIISKPLK